MKIKRIRTYYIDPHLRAKRLYTFGVLKTRYSRRTGEAYDVIRTTGSTPARAKIAGRKTRTRYEPERPTTRQDLALDRRVRENFIARSMGRTMSPRRIRELIERHNQKKAEDNVQPD